MKHWVAALALITGPALAQSDSGVSPSSYNYLHPVALLADLDRAVGYRWQTTCTVFNAEYNSASCRLVNNEGFAIGWVLFDLQPIGKDNRVRALTHCAGPAHKAVCHVYLTGDVVKTDYSTIQFKDARLEWQQPLE